MAAVTAIGVVVTVVAVDAAGVAAAAVVDDVSTLNSSRPHISPS